MPEEIVNRVARSGIITLDLEEFYPPIPIKTFDIKAGLWQGLILKEKDFRAFVEECNWSQFEGAHVCVFCSEEEAIIQTWAYMLVSSKLSGTAHSVFIGTEEQFLKLHYRKELDGFMAQNDFTDRRVVVKGCGDKLVPADAYAYATTLLQPKVKMLMFGEPCSTVPVYKKSRY